MSYAPFLHLMIRRATGFYFKGECEHYAYRPKIPQAPKPPRASSPSSPIKKALSAIFGICKKNVVKIKSNERNINQILRDSGHEIPPKSEDKDYIDPFVAYEAEVAARAAGASSSRAPQDSDEETKEEENEDAEEEEDNDDDEEEEE
uniref:Uncharacterized protein n=1 Tax=Oryza brachyantha TaxID=4533 RepID=J3N802_ORYBR